MSATDTSDTQNQDAGNPQATGPEDELTTLRREVDALRDKNLRLVADGRNMQQRAARDKEETIRYAEADFAREVLPVIDGLERSLASAASAGDGQAVVEGVRIVYEQFLKALKARHVERIDALGKPFDPTYHEALLQRPSSDHAPGTVIEEVQPGYRMRDRVLRAARVVVASGPSTE